MREKPFNIFLDFFKNNPAYIFCSLIYYIITSFALGGTFLSFLCVLIVYIISNCICFSKRGEKILRAIHHVRKIETKQEKEVLSPLFDEIYEKAKENTPELQNIELCVIDSMAVNACAIGTHTVAVSKGAMETFEEEQLKSILAHEVAHIAHKDTIAIQFAYIGNGFISLFVIVLQSLLLSIEIIFKRQTNQGFIGFGYIFLKFILQLSINIFMFIMNLVIAKNSREHEYSADHYVYLTGYGNELIEALYLLEKINLGDSSTAVEKLLQGHPRITSRIEKLEQLDIEYVLFKNINI